MLKLHYFGHLMWRADIRKDLDAGKDWRQEEKGMTKDEMIGWHHQLNGHEFEQALGDEGQGSLECRSPWGRKELDVTERLNNNHLWNLPRPGIEPVSPVSEGGFLTTGPPRDHTREVHEIFRKVLWGGQSRYYWALFLWKMWKPRHKNAHYLPRWFLMPTNEEAGFAPDFWARLFLHTLTPD